MTTDLTHLSKKILYIDMDGVIVDFDSGLKKIAEDIRQKYIGEFDNIPGIFDVMEPMSGAIDAIHKLSKHYDLYILSTAPWDNPTAWLAKINWVRKYFGEDANSPIYKRLILTHHKHLNRGDYIIDDRTKNGVDKFVGEHIHFGTEAFKNWQVVCAYLQGKDGW